MEPETNYVLRKLNEWHTGVYEKNYTEKLAAKMIKKLLSRVRETAGAQNFPSECYGRKSRISDSKNYFTRFHRNCLELEGDIDFYSSVLNEEHVRSFFTHKRKLAALVGELEAKNDRIFPED